MANPNDHNTNLTQDKGIFFDFQKMIPNLDQEHPLELKMKKSFNNVSLETNLDFFSTNDMETLLSKLGNQKNPSLSYETIMEALVFVILVHPPSFKQFTSLLNIINKDQFNYFSDMIFELVSDKQFFRINVHSTRRQIIKVIHFLLSRGAQNMSRHFIFLIRQIRKSDLRSDNIKFTEHVLKLINRNIEWVKTQTPLMPITVYAFMRLVLDHHGHREIQKLEINLVMHLLTTKFEQCMSIGRDLFRLLMDATHYDVFKIFWYKLLSKPTDVCPSLTMGIWPLLKTPTPSGFHQALICPDIEEKIEFMLWKLNGVQVSYHLRWFHQEHLESKSNEYIIADIIRYIIGFVHPTNELISSNIMQRYDLVYYLVKPAKNQNPLEASSIKHSLFFDWYFYTPERDTIMNIEPGILVLQNYIASVPNICCLLVEFLFFASQELWPYMKSSIQSCLQVAFQDAIKLKIIQDPQNLYTLYPPEYQVLFQKLFPSFYHSSPVSSSSSQNTQSISSLPSYPFLANDMITDTKTELPSSSNDNMSIKKLLDSESHLNELPLAFESPSPLKRPRQVEDIEDNHEKENEQEGALEEKRHVNQENLIHSHRTPTSSMRTRKVLFFDDDEDATSHMYTEFSRQWLTALIEERISAMAQILDHFKDIFLDGSIHETIRSSMEHLVKTLVEYWSVKLRDPRNLPESLRFLVSRALNETEHPLYVPLMLKVSITIGQSFKHRLVNYILKFEAGRVEKKSRLSWFLSHLYTKETYSRIDGKSSTTELKISKHKYEVESNKEDFNDDNSINNSYFIGINTTTIKKIEENKKLHGKHVSKFDHDQLFAFIQYMLEEKTTEFYENFPMFIEVFSFAIFKNMDIIHKMIALLDSSHILNLNYNLVKSKTCLSMKSSKQLREIIEHSLNWPSMDQICLWNLIYLDFMFLKPVHLSDLLKTLSGKLKSDHTEAYLGLYKVLIQLPKDPLVVEAIGGLNMDIKWKASVLSHFT